MNNPWTAMSLAIVLLAVAWLSGSINRAFLIALVIGAIVAFIVPPAMVGLFGAAILFFLYEKWQTIFSNFGRLTKGGAKT